MSRTPWYESENPDRVAAGAGSRLAVWIVVAVVFFGLLGAGTWAFKVATSDVKGQGDAVQVKNSAPNRIAAQERFESLYAEVKASDQRLDALAADKKATPTDRAAGVRYTGAISYCISVVNDYNAEARKYRSQDFRSVDLPAQIDQSDPATDCKEN